MSKQNNNLAIAVAVAVAGGWCLLAPWLWLIGFGLVLLIISLGLMARAWFIK